MITGHLDITTVNDALDDLRHGVGIRQIVEFGA